jgi:hypothetical protein
MDGVIAGTIANTEFLFMRHFSDIVDRGIPAHVEIIIQKSCSNCNSFWTSDQAFWHGMLNHPVS